MPADCYILGLVIKSPQNKTHVVLVAGYVKWIKTVWSTARSCKFFCSLPVDVFYVVWFMCLTLQRKEPVRSVNQVLFLWRVTLLNSNFFSKILSRGQLSSWVMRQRGRKLQNYGAFLGFFMVNCQICCYPTWLFSVSGPVDMLPCNEILSLRHDFVLKLIWE